MSTRNSRVSLAEEEEVVEEEVVEEEDYDATAALAANADGGHDFVDEQHEHDPLADEDANEDEMIVEDEGGDDEHDAGNDKEAEQTDHPHDEGDQKPAASTRPTSQKQRRSTAAAAPNSLGHGVNNNNNSSSSGTISAYAAQHQQQCPNCGGRAIEQHEASGASICTDCGVVVEENAIVSSVEFVEGANGGNSSMVGQFVSATSSKAYTGGGGGSGGGGPRGGGRYGFSRDSRETTLANGRRRIQELASRLRLGSHFVDGAHRLFTVAVEKNFVQGRRTAHVVATCLYMACRQEKSQHMLIDFSDALQVNVYSLGTCFLKFRRLLGLKLEIIDPALYVYRFAAHLDLDDKANLVSLTALRLVARMKRDWIVAGRRPAGICAAALLIAARAHGLDKQTTDVTRILRVCGMTVTTRVREFERTPTAMLTLEQFQTVDFDTEADPPIYTKNKIREARATAIQQGNVALLTSGALDDSGKFGSKWRELRRKSAQQTVKFQTVYSDIEKKMADGDNGNNDTTNELALVPGGADANDNGLEQNGDGEIVAAEDWRLAYPKAKGKDIVMAHEATLEEQQLPAAPTEAKLSLAEWKKDMPDFIDEELDSFFRTEEEEQVKEAIFNKINKDYIAQQARKESERLNAEAANKDQEEDDMAQAAGQARYKDTRSKKQQRGGRDAAYNNGDGSGGGPVNNGTAGTTEEQLRAAVAARKVSRKINYDALSSLFDDDGSFATDAAPDENEQLLGGSGGAAEEDDLMFGDL